MRQYDYNGVEYHASVDLHDKSETLEDINWHIEYSVVLFRKRRLFREVLAAYSKVTGLEKYIMLDAHGKRYKGTWRYYDGKRRNHIQHWIDKHDGKRLGLLLYCCNDKNDEITSKHSIVIHANDHIREKKLERGGFLRMFVPGYGYLEDNPHRLRSVIEELKKI